MAQLKRASDSLIISFLWAKIPTNKLTYKMTRRMRRFGESDKKLFKNIISHVNPHCSKTCISLTSTFNLPLHFKLPMVFLFSIKRRDSTSKSRNLTHHCHPNWKVKKKKMELLSMKESLKLLRLEQSRLSLILG